MKVRYISKFVPAALSMVGVLSCEAPCEDTGSCGPYDGGAAGAAMHGGRPGAGGSSGIAGGATFGGSGGQSGSGAGRGGADSGGGDGGESGSGGEGGGVPLGCDLTKSPMVEACLVSDEHAVFVSPAGSDRNPGTKSEPLASLAKAMAFAFQKKSIVIACGEYSDALTITSGIRLYGGFDCSADWTYGTADRARVAPGAGAGPALVVEGVTDPVVIEGFEFRAAAAPEPVPGESVIAAFVSKSEAVVLRDVKLVAGDAADGEDAQALAPFASRAEAGNDADMLSGGAAKACSCPIGGNTAGGRGGDGDPDGTGKDAKASPGGDGTPNRGGGKGGVLGETCSDGGIGGTGEAAPAQAAGKGAGAVGTWEDSAWVPGAGEPGLSGLPGQGGGGGRGGDSDTTEPGKGGGGGGCGGCGGEGGGYGRGGGASIALVVVDSMLSFESGEVLTGKAGRGGSGAPGQAGQLGGLGGNGAGQGCDGGMGGKGSAGAPGGGGAGGISVGVLWLGSEPLLDDAVMIETGAFGEGGEGGDDAHTTDDGIRGKNDKTLSL